MKISSKSLSKDPELTDDFDEGGPSIKDVGHPNQGILVDICNYEMLLDERTICNN